MIADLRLKFEQLVIISYVLYLSHPIPSNQARSTCTCDDFLTAILGLACILAVSRLALYDNLLESILESVLLFRFVFVFKCKNATWTPKEASENELKVEDVS